MARRSMETITGITLEQLDNYNPACFDAVQQQDGTFHLVPVRWTNQQEFNDYAFGTGDWSQD